MSLPDPETRLVPEGVYRVTIKEEPTQRSHQGANGEFVTIHFIFRLTDGTGNHSILKDSMVPWEDRYTELAYALGAPEEGGRPRMSKIDRFTGKAFDAEVKHVPDKTDPLKSWARLTNISSTLDEDEDVPPPIDDISLIENEPPVEVDDTPF